MQNVIFFVVCSMNVLTADEDDDNVLEMSKATDRIRGQPEKAGLSAVKYESSEQLPNPRLTCHVTMKQRRSIASHDPLQTKRIAQEDRFMLISLRAKYHREHSAPVVLSPTQLLDDDSAGSTSF